MGGYSAYLESAAAVALDTGFAWLMAVANTGHTLTRVTLNVKLNTAAAVTDFEAVVGINRVTSAGTTPTAGPIVGKKNQQLAANQAAWDSAFATPPTNSTNDLFRISFNTKTTVDLPFNLFTGAGGSNGLAFINRNYALPANHSYVISVEWDE